MSIIAPAGDVEKTEVFPSTTDPYATLFNLLQPAHLDSFMHAFEITEMSEEDTRAAEIELQCRVALELNMPHVLGKEQTVLAWRQHQCRVEHSKPHACRPLVYQGMHARCDHC